MSEHGAALAADLVQLELIGRVDLPMLAFVYAELNRTVANSANDQACFALPEALGDASVAQRWTALRDTLQDVLGRTATTLDDTAAAILHISRVYADSDTAAADALHRAWTAGPPHHELDPRSEIVPVGPHAPVILPIS